MRQILAIAGIIMLIVLLSSYCVVLHLRVLSLEEKLHALEMGVHINKRANYKLQSFLVASDVNEMWRKKEFNGIPYYIIPTH